MKIGVLGGVDIFYKDNFKYKIYKLNWYSKYFFFLKIDFLNFLVYKLDLKIIIYIMCKYVID